MCFGVQCQVPCFFLPIHTKASPLRNGVVRVTGCVPLAIEMGYCLKQEYEEYQESPFASSLYLKCFLYALILIPVYL